jgi:phosphoribosylamine---glycine ligase
VKTLVIGGGGREHALAWRLRNSPSVKTVFAAPGNPGAAEVAECHESADYVELAEHLGVDLTVVGPEVPLVSGIVDRFRARNLPVVGPTAENAALEGSKIHSKRFMENLGIPTARFQIVSGPGEVPSDFRYPVVLKTDGLAGGKGVVIAANRAQVDAALGSLPFPMVIEEFLEGEEVSFIVLCDGKRAVPLEPSQDHKRIFDGDEGPNTGGMGAYSDSRILGDSERAAIMDIIIEPVVRATGYTGFLYAGLMMTPAGPNVLEFNVRLGDPETQPLMIRLQSDWGEVLMAAACGSLDCDRLAWSPDPATCVVLSAEGYPGVVRGGDKISGLEAVDSAVVFQAGTKRRGADLVTAGGRVLGVTASGLDLESSINAAYAAVGAKGLRRYNNLDRARSSVG